MSRRWLVAIVLVLLGLLGWMIHWGPQQPVPAAVAAAPTASVAVDPPASPSSIRLPAQPARPAARSPAEPAPWLTADWETSAAGLLESREWCTQAVRRERMGEDARRRTEHQPGVEPPEFEPDVAMDRAQARALLRWATQLQAEGDEAALALADFLLAVAPVEQPGARERLLQRAQRSSQGLVIGLALQRCQGSSDCMSRLARRWTQQEPDNAAAWLYSVGAMTPTDVLTGLQGAMRTQDYQLLVTKRLLGLARAPSVGLRDAAELQLLSGMSAAWILPSWMPLIQHCRAVPQPAECARGAERLWRLEDPQLLNRMLTIRLAGEQGRVAPEWRARAAEAEAVAQWGHQQSEADIQAWRAVESCDPGQDTSARLRARLSQPEWQRLTAELREHQQSVAELAERRRQRSGGSLLDPPKP